MIPSTPSSRAIWGRGLLAPLYRMVEVREITVSDLIEARSAISSSVRPSAKYSCRGSPDRLASGSTASDRMRAPDEPPPICPGQRITFVPTSTVSVVTAIPAA